MVEWLAPVCFFWILTSIYLGGTAIEIRGGGPRQLFAVFVTFALYLVTFFLIRMVARGLGPVASVVAATVGAAFLLPILARIGFRVLGVRLSRPAAAH